MSIRFTIIDRESNEAITVPAPRRGEYVKDGVRKLAPPSADACAAIKGLIKDRSRLVLA